VGTGRILGLNYQQEILPTWFDPRLAASNLQLPKGSRKKIAILGDALVVSGGTERVTLFLSDIFPDAPIYTSVCLPEKTCQEFKGSQIITMPLSGRVKNERQFKRLFPWW
jgi:hypothetical protein